MQLISLDPRLIITSLLLRFVKIIEYENERTRKYTPSTQLNTRCIMGNSIHEKTQLEGEAYALLSFLRLYMQIQRK